MDCVDGCARPVTACLRRRPSDGALRLRRLEAGHAEVRHGPLLVNPAPGTAGRSRSGSGVPRGARDGQQFKTGDHPGIGCTADRPQTGQPESGAGARSPSELAAESFRPWRPKCWVSDAKRGERRKLQPGATRTPRRRKVRDAFPLRCSARLTARDRPPDQLTAARRARRARRKNARPQSPQSDTNLYGFAQTMARVI